MLRKQIWVPPYTGKEGYLHAEVSNVSGYKQWKDAYPDGVSATEESASMGATGEIQVGSSFITAPLGDNVTLENSNWRMEIWSYLTGGTAYLRAKIYRYRDGVETLLFTTSDSPAVGTSYSKIVWVYQAVGTFELLSTDRLVVKIFANRTVKSTGKKIYIAYDHSTRDSLVVDPTLLTYKDKYVVASTTAVTTTSSSLVDDTEAVKTFTLDASKVVLVIYQANNVYGATMSTAGMQNAISVDGTDYAKSWDSPDGANYCVRNCVFWVGTLSAGSHTVKGRFASNAGGSTATISNRVLVIVIFDGDEFQYIDNATTATASNTTFVDDSYAQVTFTPSATCKALILYNITNNGATESSYGKKAAINVAETDYAQAEKSPYGADSGDSVFSCHALSLSANSTTVKGRFANAGAAETVTIHRRQLAVLLLADSTLLDISTSTTQVSTTSSSLVDDTAATLSRITTDTRELLVVAMGTKRHNVTSSAFGECYGIKIDANDRAHSRGSPYSSLRANSVGTAYAEQLTAGSHTVQGRFSNNSGTNTAIISARQVVALWFSVAGGATTYTKTYTADALFKKLGITKTYTTDTLFQKQGLTKTYTIDAILKKIGLKQYQIDALLTKLGIPKTYTIDSLFKKPNITTTYNIDTLLKKTGLTKNYTIDALLKKLNLTKDYPIDSLFKKLGVTKTYTVDTVFQAQGVNTYTKTYTIDALLKKLGITTSYSIDTLFKKLGLTKTYTVDSTFVLRKTKTYTLDTLLQKLNITRSYTIDTIIGQPTPELPFGGGFPFWWEKAETWAPTLFKLFRQERAYYQTQIQLARKETVTVPSSLQVAKQERKEIKAQPFTVAEPVQTEIKVGTVLAKKENRQIQAQPFKTAEPAITIIPAQVEMLTYPEIVQAVKSAKKRKVKK